MRKILHLGFLLLLSQVAVFGGAFTAVVEVDSTKSDGKPWDIAGGAPDIWVFVDGKATPFDKQCKNKYRCSTAFASDKQEWYIEVYDKDIKESDLIGKGSCKLGDECILGRAKIKISQ